MSMGDKLRTSIETFEERLDAAGLADLVDLNDDRVVQVGQLFAEALGLALGPDAHRVIGQATVHVRRGLARARGPAREEG
jgi:hypothetical protein